jgi:hypothetical protein
MAFDEHGWHVGGLAPLGLGEAYGIFAPEDDGRIVEGRWRQQAGRFFRAELSLLTPKIYPAGHPRRDVASVAIGRVGGPAGTVELSTLPLDEAPEWREAARLGAASLGGFDALVERSRRLWLLHPPEPEVEPRATLALAAVLASVLLGPVLAPDGGVFGVKGARERLARVGWRT